MFASNVKGDALERTRHSWALWVNKEGEQAPCTPLTAADLPQAVCQLYRRSLLILRTQIDNNGAIIAANDFDIARSGRDTYAYMWPHETGSG